MTNKKRLNLKLIKFELVNLSSNIFVLIFGVLFPIGMALLMAFVFGSEGEYTASAHTGMFISMSVMIPLATMLMGHATNYATELEAGAVQRFKLFGYTDRTIVLAKMIAQMLFLLVAMIVYSVVLLIALDITVPTIAAAFTFIAFFLLFSASLFLLGHAIASLCGRMGPTFGIIMAIYFTLGILGGNMGPPPGMLPNGMRHIAMGLPLYYISTYFSDTISGLYPNVVHTYGFWNGGDMNWLPFIITTLAFVAISAGLFTISLVLIKKGKIKQSAKPVYYD